MSMTETGDSLMAAQQLPPELMLLKMENESIMAVARGEPRDPKKMVDQLQELIDAYPAAADDAIYSKPVGTIQEVTCGKCGIKYEVDKVVKETACPECESRDRAGVRPVKKFAEGLSIRAAESIRTIFGFTRLATTCEILGDGSARLTGVLVDYVAGNVTSDERIVSRHYKSKHGGMVTVAEDRFLNVVVKAEKSKLRRDVILDSTPGIVKAMFRDACEQKMIALVSPEVIQQKIIPAFARYQLTPAHLDQIIGSPHALGWNKGQRLELRKILTALKNEETTRAELLADLDKEGPGESVKKPAGGGATMDDLTKPPQRAETSQVDPAVDKAEGVDESPEPTVEEEEAQIAEKIEKATMAILKATTIIAVNDVLKEAGPELAQELKTKAEHQKILIRSQRGPKAKTEPVE